ncbi:inorganic phosphate transporter [Pseudanabaena sp. 'Roaring Creek']|uniref:inorganic phosphate transporter n=1 Tax=Pseudanabaena sp. 'Roaring Creek' TaxID=1681830 RepID=UPI0006D82A25|nr:inorganic phosphate transporter [Pseudanabaena sp. 'Roaring Creek']
MDILSDLPLASGIFLVLALLLALGFEFVNGFHDTANAVATVIYTNTLKPNYAVVWSGMWNLIGVLTSSGAVAFGIIALLPVELVVNAGSGAGFAMVFALLISAILWNVGTWYLGLPASSSHTLIGSILGVGLANSVASGAAFGEGVNWGKATEVFESLLISPIIGFVATALLFLGAKALIKNEALYRSPEGKTPPPLWIRGLLMLTCTGVSFAHGSNDGQKGMGLIMLILIGILPGVYALDLTVSQADFSKLYESSKASVAILDKKAPQKSTLQGKEIDTELSSFLKSGNADEKTFAALSIKNHAIADKLSGKTSFQDVSKEERKSLRTDIYLVDKAIDKLEKKGKLTDTAEKDLLVTYKKQLVKSTEFIPDYVKFAVAIALGLGTMIGWKRIVITVGEKIGKDHLTYAQGASAELVAMVTIGAADTLGLPVSTTHVLSSGIAGAMTANGSGIQKETVRNLIIAWVLTLPVCILLGAMTFSAGLFVVFNVLGLK